MDTEGEQMWDLEGGAASAVSLRRLPLFALMPEPELTSLAEHTTWRVYHPYDLIVRPGDARGNVYVIDRGQVRIFSRVDEQQKLTVLFLGSGDVMDFNDLPPGPAEHAFAEAVTEPTVVNRVPRETLHHVLFSPGSPAAVLDEQTRRALMKIALLLWEQVFQDAPSRLAHELARLATWDEDRGAMMVWETHEQLGELTHIPRQRVTELLQHFKRRGLVDFAPHRHGITVIDAQRLADEGCTA